MILSPNRFKTLYRDTPVEEYVRERAGGAGFDIVYDTVGGAVLDASFTSVRRYTGHVVSALCFRY